MKRFIGLLFTILLSACTTNTNTSNELVLKDSPEITFNQEESRSFMIGSWYGKQPTVNGGIRQEIIKRKKDGTYKLKFLLKKANGEITESIEVGQWGIVGPVYFSIFMGWVEEGRFYPSDPESADNYDAYEILDLNHEYFKYQSYSSKSVYTLKKVAEGFEFPEI